MMSKSKAMTGITRDIKCRFYLWLVEKAGSYEQKHGLRLVNQKVPDVVLALSASSLE